SDLDDVAELELAVKHEVSAVPEDGDERECGQEIDEGQEAGAEPRRLQGTVAHLVGFVVELAFLEAFGSEALDGAHAGDALLDHGGEVAELRLQLGRDRLHALAEAR